LSVPQRTSAAGDPDLFILFGAFPRQDLGHWDFKATDNDAAAANANKPSVVRFSPAPLVAAFAPHPLLLQVEVPSDKLRKGRYYLGVQGYCCQPSEFTLTILPSDGSEFCSFALVTIEPSDSAMPLCRSTRRHTDNGRRSWRALRGAADRRLRVLADLLAANKEVLRKSAALAWPCH
jgi:hypothetical protein